MDGKGGPLSSLAGVGNGSPQIFLHKHAGAVGSQPSAGPLGTKGPLKKVGVHLLGKHLGIPH